MFLRGRLEADVETAVNCNVCAPFLEEQDNMIQGGKQLFAED